MFLNLTSDLSILSIALFLTLALQLRLFFASVCFLHSFVRWKNVHSCWGKIYIITVFQKALFIFWDSWTEPCQIFTYHSIPSQFLNHSCWTNKLWVLLCHVVWALWSIFVFYRGSQWLSLRPLEAFHYKSHSFFLGDASSPWAFVETFE